MAGAAAASALVLASCAQASDDPSAFPEDSITITVPFDAGGPTDTVTRLVAKPMSKDLGQEIVVKNVEGPAARSPRVTSPSPNRTATSC